MIQSIARMIAAAGVATAWAGAVSPAHALGDDTTTIASIELKGTPLDKPSPYAWLGASEAERTLGDYLDAMRRAGSDSEVDGVLLRLKDAALTTTQIEELSVAIGEVREAGKKVHLFAENYGTQEVLLGALSDEVLIQAGGAVSLPGLYMEEMYLADMLAWLGVRAQLIQVGDYKGANETMTRSEPSDAWDQNISGLLDGLYANLRGHIMRGRGLGERELDEAMEIAWWADADQAIAAGLIDAQIDLPQLGEHIERRYGSDEVSWLDGYADGAERSLDMSSPFAFFQMFSREPRHEPSGPTIAVVHVQGAIVDGDSSPGGLFGAQTTGSRTIRNALEAVLTEDEIGGVVVRVDSPGGSAIASEVIWRGIRRVAESKPVFVSIGSMAASGGYYVSVAGDRIYANPSSIVGSIGVVGGKYAMGELYDKLRVRVHPRARGPMASMMSTAEPWSGAERALVRAKMRDTYELFVDRVEQGREGVDISRTAEGRLFTGSQAVELEMVDEIGTMEQTISGLADQLEWQDYDVMHYPGPKSFEDMIDEAFGGFLAAPGAGLGGSGALSVVVEAARELIGPRAWPTVASQLESLMHLREEPVQLVLPRGLIAR